MKIRILKTNRKVPLSPYGIYLYIVKKKGGKLLAICGDNPNTGYPIFTDISRVPKKPENINAMSIMSLVDFDIYQTSLIDEFNGLCVDLPPIKKLGFWQNLKHHTIDKLRKGKYNGK